MSDDHGSQPRISLEKSADPQQGATEIEEAKESQPCDSLLQTMSHKEKVLIPDVILRPGQPEALLHELEIVTSMEPHEIDVDSMGRLARRGVEAAESQGSIAETMLINSAVIWWHTGKLLAKAKERVGKAHRGKPSEWVPLLARHGITKDKAYRAISVAEAFPSPAGLEGQPVTSVLSILKEHRAVERRATGRKAPGPETGAKNTPRSATLFQTKDVAETEVEAATEANAATAADHQHPRPDDVEKRVDVLGSLQDAEVLRECPQLPKNAEGRLGGIVTELLDENSGSMIVEHLLEGALVSIGVQTQVITDENARDITFHAIWGEQEEDASIIRVILEYLCSFWDLNCSDEEKEEGAAIRLGTIQHMRARRMEEVTVADVVALAEWLASRRSRTRTG